MQSESLDHSYVWYIGTEEIGLGPLKPKSNNILLKVSAPGHSFFKGSEE